MATAEPLVEQKEDIESQLRSLRIRGVEELSHATTEEARQQLTDVFAQQEADLMGRLDAIIEEIRPIREEIERLRDIIEAIIEQRAERMLLWGDEGMGV